MTVSIIMLTHNAPKYVEQTLVTLGDVTDPAIKAECEVVVLDNASEAPVRELLGSLRQKGYIDKLHLSDVNTFFARGNNLAAEMSDASARYLLLLNSDVRIDDPNWLTELMRLKEEGGYAAAAYGFCAKPDRADGYCLLIDRDVYMKYRLDEDFPWWGGVTKLQYEMLRDGLSVLAVDNHEGVLHHHGGKSGKSYRQAGKLDERYDSMMREFGRIKGADVFTLRKKGLAGMVKEKLRKVMTAVKRI